MSERPPFGFAKPGVKALLLPLLLLPPFVAVALGFGAATLYSWRSVRAVHRYENALLGQARGRVRVAGTVARERMVTSPLGVSGVGWVGAVGTLVKDSDGDVSFKTMCVRSDLSELHIKSFLQDRSMTFAEPSDPVVLGEHSKLEDVLPIVDIGDPVEASPPVPIPEAMRRACGAALTTGNGHLTYREAVLAAGASIEVLGCAAGPRIARCDDGGSYLLTTSTVAALKAESAKGTGMIMLFGGFWNVLIMSAAGFMAAGRLVRSTPTFQERLRAR